MVDLAKCSALPLASPAQPILYPSIFATSPRPLPGEAHSLRPAVCTDLCLTLFTSIRLSDLVVALLVHLCVRWQCGAGCAHHHHHEGVAFAAVEGEPGSPRGHDWQCWLRPVGPLDAAEHQVDARGRAEARPHVHACVGGYVSSAARLSLRYYCSRRR